ncbi:hypothetical protein RclHR1_05550017 [Rhizophagus clarus]|nr:hypothetical protein RclHR1_05550017 [Rhizophagus clarus]
MLIVILAFAHTMFVLLRNPTNIKTKDSTYNGDAINTTTNKTLNIALKADFDPTSSDNPFITFSGAIIATYFWISGNMVQRDQFDYWAVDAFTLIASIILVVTVYKMCCGVYEKAENKGGKLYYDIKEKSNFDKYSILKYDVNINTEFENIINKKNELNDYIEYLAKKINELKNKNEIKENLIDEYVNIGTELENIKNKENYLNENIKYLAE